MKKISISVSEVKTLLESLEENEVTIKEILDFISDKKSKQNKDIFNKMSLVIDYSQNLKQMIIAGHYDWVNGNITESNFPFPKSLKGDELLVSAKLFYFDCLISSEDVIAKMDKSSYRPANLTELLALGAEQPYLQKRFPIVALNSNFYDTFNELSVPVLIFDKGLRKLDLRCFNHDWLGFCFLGVHK